MRSIWILCLFICSFSKAYSQTENVPKYITAISDSLRLKYPYYYTFYARAADSLRYSVNHKSKYLSFDFPVIETPNAVRVLFVRLDSLAKTPVYTNKVFAHEMYSAIPERLNKNISPASSKQMHDVIHDIVISDIENTMKITDVTTFEYLKTKQFTHDIIERIARLLDNPYFNRPEAAVLSQRERPFYQIADTAGFAYKNRCFSDLSTDDKNNVRSIRRDICRSQQSDKTLPQYYDSLNGARISAFVNAWDKQPFLGVQQLVKIIGDKRIYALAPAIQKVYLSDLGKDWYATDCQLIMARLEYENHTKNVIYKYRHMLDSSVACLKLGSMSDSEKAAVVDDLYESVKKLSYVNTREAYYAMAPLLLVKEKATDDFGEFYILGAHFFLALDQRIKNFPWSYDEHAKIKEGAPGHVVDEWYIENKLPDDFLERMYRWMIKNRNKYRLVE